MRKWRVRIRQVVPVCTACSTPQLAPAPNQCCPLLSRFKYINGRTCPGMFWDSPFSPSKLSLHVRDLDSHLIVVPWAHQSRVHIPDRDGISMGSGVFAGLTIVTDRQTGRPTEYASRSQSVAIASTSYCDLRCSLIIHCVSKNVPPLSCYNLYIHGSIATIFGTNVAEKVGNQNMLYFPTSPN